MSKAQALQKMPIYGMIKKFLSGDIALLSISPLIFYEYAQMLSSHEQCETIGDVSTNHNRDWPGGRAILFLSFRPWLSEMYLAKNGD
jgi:hypothetical protein